jgi:hypothetical protein
MRFAVKIYPGTSLHNFDTNKIKMLPIFRILTSPSLCNSVHVLNSHLDARCLFLLFILHCMFRSTGHGSRAVWGMYCLRSLGSWDCGLESHSGHGCLMCVCVFFCACVVLCLGGDLATSWSLVQRIPTVLWMIKNLINQPYAPKWEKEEEKKNMFRSNWSSSGV